MAEKSEEGPQASRATVVQHPSGPSSWDFAVPGGSSPGLASGDPAFPRERERQQGQRVWVRSGQWGQMGPRPQVPHGSKSASQAVRAVSSLLTVAGLVNQKLTHSPNQAGEICRTTDTRIVFSLLTHSHDNNPEHKREKKRAPPLDIEQKKDIFCFSFLNCENQRNWLMVLLCEDALLAASRACKGGCRLHLQTSGVVCC